jgi:DNA-binding transcriptional regulator YdaS (Cro superfamily)
MNLHQYISQERGRQSSLAKAIGAHAPDVSRWADGSRPIPIQYGAPIEQATNGAVTRVEMFPDDWQRVWPELAAQELIPGTPIDGKKIREAKNGAPKGFTDTRKFRE